MNVLVSSGAVAVDFATLSNVSVLAVGTLSKWVPV